MTPLDRIVIVLHEPQDLVNIAGVVRAMKNMGLSRLVLVEPAEFDAYRITGIAHRSGDIVGGARIVETLEEAVADAVLVVGTSARPRTAQRNYVRPRELAPDLVTSTADGDVAILFGREDRGLSNQALDLCTAVAIVPTVEEYSSLNLAQACLVLAYEIFLAADAALPTLPTGRRSRGPARHSDLETMFSALEGGLQKIDFFKARAPEGVLRTLRTLLTRAAPDLHEAGLVSAIGYEIGHYVDRLPPTDEST